MSYEKILKQNISEKKCGKGRASFLQERHQDLQGSISPYEKFLQRNHSTEIQNLNGTHLITAPVIHQMKEFIGNKYNEDADLKFLKTRSSMKYDYGNDAIWPASSKNGSSKSSSLSSSSSNISTSEEKEYEYLCKSLQAHHIKSKVKRCQDYLEMENSDDNNSNCCKNWKWKPQNCEDSKFTLKPEDFPSL